jgi:hypothetical protein
MTTTLNTPANEAIMLAAAEAIANHGFAEDEFGTTDGLHGNNLLVTLNHVTLLNVGEVDLAEQVRKIGEQTFTVWVWTGNSGKIARFAPEGEDEQIVQGFEADKAEERAWDE